MACGGSVSNASQLSVTCALPSSGRVTNGLVLRCGCWWEGFDVLPVLRCRLSVEAVFFVGLSCSVIFSDLGGLNSV